MLFTQYSLLDQFYFCTSCLSIAHLKFTNKIHQLFTDYLLRLPYSELLETHLFRSRANRRLVFGRRPLPFGGSPLDAYSRTSGESNHHRQFVRDTRVPRYQLRHEDTCKYLRAMVNKYGTQLPPVYDAAKIHVQRGKGTALADASTILGKENLR